jgi:hypothetical protein
MNKHTIVVATVNKIKAGTVIASATDAFLFINLLLP